jgi:hypothetical protein
MHKIGKSANLLKKWGLEDVKIYFSGKESVM